MIKVLIVGGKAKRLDGSPLGSTGGSAANLIPAALAFGGADVNGKTSLRVGVESNIGNGAHAFGFGDDIAGLIAGLLFVDTNTTTGAGPSGFRSDGSGGTKLETRTADSDNIGAGGWPGRP